MENLSAHIAPIESTQTHSPLLQASDPPPYAIINKDAGEGLVLICDHASREVPISLSDLGIAAEHFDKHIAYDIGAESVTRNLSERLKAPAVLAGFSRLVIDLNRPLAHSGSMPEVSDDIVIPANQGLSHGARMARVTDLFEPYHSAVQRTLADVAFRGRPPVLFSVHSFSPNFGNSPRPWDVGVLWNRDPRLALPLMERLRAAGLNVGDNEPYSGRDIAFTIDSHATAAGLANCVIEINQDQVRDAAGIQRWSDILVDALTVVLKNDDLYRVEFF